MSMYRGQCPDVDVHISIDCHVNELASSCGERAIQDRVARDGEQAEECALRQPPPGIATRLNICRLPNGRSSLWSRGGGKYRSQGS